jgi:transposase-like protein
VRRNLTPRQGVAPGESRWNAGPSKVWRAPHTVPAPQPVTGALPNFFTHLRGGVLLYKPRRVAYGCAIERNSMASVLFEDHFHNEDAAYDYVESRLWPDGPVCPRCGVIKGNIRKLQGKSTRIGLYKCYVCREQFTVKVGTIFESSHLPLRMWLQAIHLLCASKKGVSARQLQRMLRVALKTAWHLGHRIREAMRDASLPPIGCAGATAKVDEFHRSQG